MPIEFTSVAVEEKIGSKIIELKITGKLEAADYAAFVPRLESAIKQHGRIRIFLELVDFHGWTPVALWEDTKFDVRHLKDIERLAIVGDSKFEKGMTVFSKPFTSAEVRYFDVAKIEEARRWIRS